MGCSGILISVSSHLPNPWHHQQGWQNSNLITLWLRSFFCYPSIGTEIISHTLTWHRVYFFMFTVWHGLFSFVLTFPRLRIAALPLSTVQGVYKQNFLSGEPGNSIATIITKPSIDKHKFSSFQDWQTRARFIGHSCLACTISSVGRFADHPRQVDKFLRPFYRPTTSKPH